VKISTVEKVEEKKNTAQCKMVSEVFGQVNRVF
jgi:hypothetical protein